MAAILEHAMTYGIDDVSRLPRLLIPSLFVVVAMAQIQPFILEPEYSSEEELLEDEVDELDLPVNVNAGRLRNSSWCKCGECSEMPTEMECVCCREMKNIEKMIESKFYTTEGIFIGDICDIL